MLVGIGAAGTLDEVLFHHLLRWHHFYDSTSNLHDRETARLGLVNGVDARGARRVQPLTASSSTSCLRLHQVREGARPETRYDIAFIAVSALVLIAGVVIVRRAPAASA